jgi:hypothetical protein
MFPLLALVFGPIAKIVGGWIEHKQAMQKAKQEGELQWAATMAEASKTSWKDEYLTIVFTAPMVFAMFGWYEPLSILLGILETAPGWYTTVILTIVSGSFGMNLLDRYKNGLSKMEYVREVIKKNGNGKADPYAAVRPSPLPPEA